MKCNSLFVFSLVLLLVASIGKGNTEMPSHNVSISEYLKERVTDTASSIPSNFPDIKTLDEYRKIVKKNLASDLGIDEFIANPNHSIIEKLYRKDFINGCVLERIDYRFDWNFFIPCHIWRPAEFEGRLPAIIVLTGGGKCDYNINMMMQKWASKGMIVLQPDYPLTEEMRDPYIGAETAGYNSGLPLIGVGTMELIRGIDYLSARGDVDPNRIYLFGLNRAVIEVLLAAVLDDRVSGVALQNISSYKAWAESMDQQAVIGLFDTPRNFVPGILEYADIPQLCATIAPGSLAIFGHDENPAYPESGYQSIAEICQKTYSMLNKESRLNTNKDIYPFASTVEWMRESPANESAGKLILIREKGYDQSDLYREMGTNIDPAFAQSNELIHSPFSYLKYKSALCASKLPEDFASIEDWKQYREKYLMAHSNFMGMEYLYNVEHPPMISQVTNVNNDYSIPDINASVVREDVIYHCHRNLFIPVTLFRPKNRTGKLPAVVLTPGWFQPKDDPMYLRLGVDLAKDGFVTICMDRIESLGSNPNLINGFSLISGTCLEGLSGARIIRALDYLITRDDVDPERIGIAGLCSGSITMWSGVPIEPRFKAIVHVSGTTNEESWSMDFNYAGDMETAFPGILKHGDIQHIYASYAPKPFLFITNRTDNWWPQPGLRKCVDLTSSIYKLYNASDRFDYRLFNATHTVDEPFHSWIVYWFKKWLDPASNPAKPADIGEILTN